MRNLTRTIAALLVFGLGTPVVAQDRFPQQLSGMLGEWSLEGENAAIYQCLVTLRDDRVVGGYRVDVPESCDAPGSEIAAWNIDENSNSVVLLDNARKPVLTLGEMGDPGLFGTEAGSGPQFFMVQPGLGE